MEKISNFYNKKMIIFNRSFFYILLINIFLYSLVYLSPQTFRGWFEAIEEISRAVKYNIIGVFCYFFIISFFPLKIKNLLEKIIIVVIFIIGLIDLFLYVNFNSFLNLAFLETFLTTDPTESKEFIQTYFDFTTITILLAYILATFLYFKLPFPSFFIPNKYKMQQFLKVILFIVCIITIIKKPNKYLYEDTLTFARWIQTISVALGKQNSYIEQLKKYDIEMNKILEISNLNITHSLNIPKIVIIMGESTQRNYMGIYGYPLDTTPQLNKIANEGNLFIFDDIISPFSHTNPSLARIFTFSNYENNTIPWYQQLNIIDIMKKANYHTYWISNQEPISIYGNAPEAISRRANETIFLSKFSSFNSNTLDEIILTKLQKNKFEKEFYIIHLAGTHTSYDKRYPQSFNIFKKENLISNNLNNLNSREKLSTRQAQIKTRYLNAIAYNDFVVSEIFKYFKDENTLVVYMSDHADEVYDFRNFHGHSESLASRFMVEIPFMIYVSDKFKKTYPEIIDKIQKAQNLPFMSDDFLHSFLDLVQIKTKQLEENRSLFNEAYNQNRIRLYANRNYDEELKQNYPFKAPSKIWLHRTNSLDKFEYFKNDYKNFEVDVHFFENENYFDVGHDGKQTSIGLDLKDLLKAAVEKDKTTHFQTKFWIDFKNLNNKNAKKALSILLKICEETNFNPKNLIIESSQYAALRAFKDANLYTSYYIKYYTKEELQKNGNNIRSDIQKAIDSKSFNALSFPYYLYEFIKQSNFKVKNKYNNLEDIDLLIWNESNDWFKNQNKEIFHDSQIKIILAGEKW
ncbi:sulfatase domain-containing protein [Campylobacter lari]|nr:sulfatase domain-containing protein [Campylobacter lari]